MPTCRAATTPCGVRSAGDQPDHHLTSRADQVAGREQSITAVVAGADHHQDGAGLGTICSASSATWSAARSIRSSSGWASANSCSAARILSTLAESRSRFPLTDDESSRQSCIVAERHSDVTHTERLGPSRHRTPDHELRLTLFRGDHLGVQPDHASRRAQCLGKRLLGREPGRQRLGGPPAAVGGVGLRSN